MCRTKPPEAASLVSRLDCVGWLPMCESVACVFNILLVKGSSSIAGLATSSRVSERELCLHAMHQDLPKLCSCNQLHLCWALEIQYVLAAAPRTARHRRSKNAQVLTAAAGPGRHVFQTANFH